ncbi:hypothetical protein [Pararhodobacter sp. SW119]|uniref:hypothetical protein n=1 Tax=Pararhodobacter sp. SW119 TaxID=2780075 RepID=UPI001AE086BD|nr:hypothetical protein [Pararhodobacter sp. SW119]
MYKRPLLPHGTRPPDSFAGPGFIARPLRLTDAEDDFAAVVASTDRLRGAMDPHDPWPDGLTLRENRVDLGWHEREHTAGHSFAWTVRDPGDRLTLGCAYLYPADRVGADAMAFWWARTGHEALDTPLGAAFRALIAALPLSCAFPGRDETWADWQTRASRF